MSTPYESIESMPMSGRVPHAKHPGLAWYWTKKGEEFLMFRYRDSSHRCLHFAVDRPESAADLADKLDLADDYNQDELDAVSEAYLTDAPGEVIAKHLAPVVTRWQKAMAEADDKGDREEALAFRANAGAYRHAWDFMSQIVDFQDPELHRRAILAGLLIRNLHLDQLIDTFDTSSVELVGLAVVATKVDGDNTVPADADGTDLPAPGFDGDRGREHTPEQVALIDAIDQVNKLFAASGLELGIGSGEAWTRAVWGALSDDPEVQAMSAENTGDQLKASPKFKDKITGAVVAVAEDSTAMTEAVMSNSELLEGLQTLMAKAISIIHGQAA